MSGFTITLDAVIAIVVLGLMVAIAVDILGDKEFNEDNYIVRYGYDFATVADKSGALEEVLETNTKNNKLRDMIRYLPESLCIEIDVFKDDATAFYHAQNYCDNEDNYNAYKVSRLVSYKGDVYPTTFILWYG